MPWERGVGHVVALGVCGGGQSVERERQPDCAGVWISRDKGYNWLKRYREPKAWLFA